MKKQFILLIICFVFYTDFFAQKLTSILYPSYIAKNTQFEVSFIGNFEKTFYDYLYLYLVSDDDINVNKASITFGEEYKDLPIEREKNSYGNVVKIIIRKSQFPKSEGSTYQLLINSDAGDLSAAQMMYVLGGTKDKKKYIFNSSFIDNPSSKIPNKLLFSFYEKGTKSGKALKLKSNGSLNLIANNYDLKNDLLIEFWTKCNIQSGNWFGIVDKNNNSNILSLSISELHLLEIKSDNVQFYYDDYHISKNQWYHFSVLINPKRNSVRLYINDKQIYRFNVNTDLDGNDLEVRFENDSEKGTLYLDALKIWDYNNTIVESFQRKNYPDERADSSYCLFSNLFDDYGNFQKLVSDGKIITKAKSFDIVDSDAPLFSKLPEFDVSVYNSYANIEWKSANKNAEKFIVEKSDNGNSYYSIYSTDATSDLSNVYFYSDSKEKDKNVLFYRLKQINNDGSIVYSNPVKVGIAEKELFEVKQNYPNPFNPTTSITVEVFETTYINIAVYNIVGKEIAVLHQGTLSAGEHKFDFDGTGLPSGIYFCQVSNKSVNKVQKMILTK